MLIKSCLPYLGIEFRLVLEKKDLLSAQEYFKTKKGCIFSKYSPLPGLGKKSQADYTRFLTQIFLVKWYFREWTFPLTFLSFHSFSSYSLLPSLPCLIWGRQFFLHFLPLEGFGKKNPCQITNKHLLKSHSFWF